MHRKCHLHTEHSGKCSRLQHLQWSSTNPQIQRSQCQKLRALQLRQATTTRSHGPHWREAALMAPTNQRLGQRSAASYQGHFGSRARSSQTSTSRQRPHMARAIYETHLRRTAYSDRPTHQTRNTSPMCVRPQGQNMPPLPGPANHRHH